MSDTNLKVTALSDLKKELFSTPAQSTEDIEAKAVAYVDKLLDVNTDNMDALKDRKNSVEQMAFDEQKKAARQTELLRQPVKKLSERGQEGGDVANAFINLKMKVEELDPGKFDFEAGWMTRTLGRLPGVETPIKRYFSKFENAKTVIGTIIRSLENGKEKLLRDNITLFKDQKLKYKLEREIPATDPKHKFIGEEFLFPLRQRIIDLQQQLAVNQQTVLATEIIIRNNKELTRGVDRALNVTISALETAASVAMALANQKIVLDKINSINQTTSDLIKGLLHD
jgi:uncharacterized protein YaaN involved in tellurite resistance